MDESQYEARGMRYCMGGVPHKALAEMVSDGQVIGRNVGPDRNGGSWEA